MSRYKYSYSILRYVHDIGTAEFFSVGIAVFEPSTRFLRVILRDNLGLAGGMVGPTQVADFPHLVKPLIKKINLLEKQVKEDLPEINSLNDLQSCLLSLIPKDASALRWTEVQQGLSRDLEQTAAHLYQRYCAKYDRLNKGKKAGKSDKDVWRKFQADLRARKLDGYFEPKVIEGQNDEVEFDFAWKNGVWHCVEPVSFDLQSVQSIKEKAYSRAGELVGISDVLKKEKIQVYFVAAAPKDKGLFDEFQKALRILEQSPGHPKAYMEQDVSILLDSFNERIAAH